MEFFAKTITNYFLQKKFITDICQGPESDPRRDSGSAGAKKVLDASENDTKANFQESIPGKVQFQEISSGGHQRRLVIES